MKKVPDQFHHSVLHDPLFAAEGMDIVNASDAIHNLEEALGKLERAHTDISWRYWLFLKRYSLARYAVPVSFLKHVIESERLRRQFLVDSTEDKAQELLKQWRVTAQCLQSSVRRYRRLHEVIASIERADDSFSFQDMFGNISTLRYIRKTLSQFERNAACAVSEVEERERLFQGREHGYDLRVFECEPLTFREGKLSSDLAYIHDLQIKYKLLPDGEVLETHGPLVYTLPHFEGMPTDHVFFLYILRNKSGRKTVRILLADEFFFLKIGEGSKGYGGIGKANFKQIIERGVPYWSQLSTNLYTTRDQSYQMDIATIVDLRRRPELNKHLVCRQRSSMFDLMLQESARGIGSFIKHTKGRARAGGFGTYSFLFGLLVRSQPSINFMIFNESVWRLKEKPDILGESRTPFADLLYRPSREIVPNLDHKTLELIMRAAIIREEARRAEGIIE
jgi:hypothetical protein